MRMYSPSPTVHASPVPIYMRGWPPTLGQEDIPLEPSTFDPGGSLIPPDFGPTPDPIFLSPSGADLGLEPSIFDPTGPLIAPSEVSSNTRDIANLYAAGVATGAITPLQAAELASRAATDLAHAAAAANRPNLPTIGPSPRVATSAVPQKASLVEGKTVIGGMAIPNIALIGAGALLLFAAMGKR